MADDINPAVIKHTQEMLGKYVKKPTLTDKLLKKPPFRFLHDVFAVVIRDTGCFEGLYTKEELNSENIKDRDDKMRFLQKMIDVVRICTNVPMTVKTSKIVAGHEPEKTNELLQLMAKIIENKLNWQPAVEQVVKGKEVKTTEDKPIKEKAKAKTKTKDKDKDKDVAVKSKESSKTSKPTTKISKQSSVAKEDKPKRPKDRDKPNEKVNKTEEKLTKRKVQDSGKPKLTKMESQTSTKSIPPNKEIKQTNNEKAADSPLQCNHDDELKEKELKRGNSFVKESKEEAVINSSIREVAQTNEDNLSIPPAKEDEAVQNPRNVSAKSKAETPAKSPPRPDSNSRKSSAKSRKSIDLGSNEIAEGKSTEKTNYRSIDLGSNEIAEGKSTEKINYQQVEPMETIRNSPKKSEIIDLPVSLPKPEELPKPEPVPTVPAVPNSVNNEVKRESTFTRENSKELPNKTNRPRTSLRPPSARPPSARPGAPRRRDRNIEIILQPNDPVKISGIQVKLETFGDLDDDGENLVIIENANATNDEVSDDISSTNPERAMGNETMEQGHLVQQILETQKELTQQKDFNQQIKSDKDSVNGMVMKQSSMNNLRDVIQGLTKSVNPLGKLMDFIPEDIDAMQLEFTMWRDAYTQAANQLKREKSLTESATEPMKNQLIQIEANIQEYMEMIDASRVKILQNNDKILKMLTTS